MAIRKGSDLEELVRAYFSRQGFFALRSVSYRYDEEEVTDIDVWLYSRQSASVRTKIIVDAKDKKSPKAFERILWTKGMQIALGCDRAIVATTDCNPKVVQFAQQQKVSILNKGFLEKLERGIETKGRLTLEQFIENIQTYQSHKQDGDWLKRISDAKSSLASLHGFPAFNKAMSSFRFFSERAETRPHHREQAIRCAFLSAAIGCIALDSALERVIYEDHHVRYNSILKGVTYGDAGDARTQKSIETVLNIISRGVENGRVIAKQARDGIHGIFEGIRAEIIAETFSREQNAAMLFSVARELDNKAFGSEPKALLELSKDAKSIIGIFADFVEIGRKYLLTPPQEIEKNESSDTKEQEQMGMAMPQSGKSAPDISQGEEQKKLF
ncbi:hypothetical protein [Azospirillum sp. TSH64]|uniref:restriction endonuclease n=1 Tax=Azospirillum sp. TSH64 TaxID=652740 RepID=UPI0011B239B1|nr:hypothetical protein [Azospirillum sp. TSH64]